MQSETGNITPSLAVDPTQVQKPQEEDHRVQLDHDCRITTSKSMGSGQ